MPTKKNTENEAAVTTELWEAERTCTQTLPPGAQGPGGSPGETAGRGDQSRGDILLWGSRKSPERRGVCPEPRRGGFGQEVEEGHSGGDNYVSRDGRGAGVGGGTEGPLPVLLPGRGRVAGVSGPGLGEG